MNDLQIGTISIADNNDLGNTGVTMRQVNYLATYDDHTHLEGFVLINDNDFTAMSMNDVKAQIQKSLVTNLGGTVNNGKIK
ncbi:hypothetical protein N6G96_05965 [Pediococcus inopinatus]|uniref:Uncharacterized protein n=1 Tax=Pediococcus inopinatus TaxID=114090 RepID=A0ABZ0Q365_9LACO|nr:hypothetical protein [Pediococcus inopinatus]WPC20854.1 hypothetical protein N6G96_05965 [Pediococcus inopinatus]